MRPSFFAATLAVALVATGCDSAGIDAVSPLPGTPPGTGTTLGEGTPPDTTSGTGTTPASTFLEVRPTATYLRADAATPGTVAASLAEFGLKPGDTACFKVRGDFYRSAGVRASDSGEPLVTAAFSASANLSAPSERTRIKDAIDAGPDVATPPTDPSGAATDIDEDFDATKACVSVPAGATHVFVSAFDTFHLDNTDALVDGNAFGVELARR